MDKQKQVEEIAKERKEIHDIMKLLSECVSLNPMCKCEVATVIYGNNYRKIPENAVVLTREELHEIEENAYQVGVTMGKKFGGKEAAENYYQKMKVALGILCFGNQKIHDENNAIAKQFGVEVER